MNLNSGRPATVSPPGGKVRGFTLLEILLVLALMALLSGLFVAGGAKLLDGNNAKAPSDLFWESVQIAQEAALRTEKPVVMRYDSKEKALVWSGGESGRKTLPDNVSIQFLQAAKGGSLVLIGGVVVETQEIPAVTFYPDGTCDAFRVQIRQPAGATSMGVDPWTCAPVLDKDKTTS